MNRLAKILRKRDGQGLVEEADDLGVAAVSIRDLQEGDPFELAENVQANYVGVEALDALEVLHAENCLTQGAYARVHRSSLFNAQDDPRPKAVGSIRWLAAQQSARHRFHVCLQMLSTSPDM